MKKHNKTFLSDIKEFLQKETLFIGTKCVDIYCEKRYQQVSLSSFPLSVQMTSLLRLSASFFLYLFLLVILLLNLSVLCYQPSCFTVIVESTVTHTHPHVSSHERTAVLLRQITWTVKLKLDHLTLNMGQTTTNYHRKFTFSLHAEHIFMCLYSTFWNSPTFTNANVTRLLLLLKWTENFWGQ